MASFKKQINLDFALKAMPSEGEEIAEFVNIVGHASTTGQDRHGDIIAASAWQSGIENYLKNPILLFNHKYDRPIGNVTSLSVDDSGLVITGSVLNAEETIFSLVKQGVLKAFSVGILVKDAFYDSVKDIFVITDLELLEISVVSVPANQDALFSVAKAFESNEELESFKKSFAKGQEDTSLSLPAASKNKEVLKMDEKQIADLTAAAVQKAMDALEAKRTEEAKIVAEKAAKEKTAEATSRQVAIEVMASGTEALVAEITKRLATENATVSKALEDLRVQTSEKALEIEALLKSKARFDEKGSEDGVSYEEKEKAVLMSYILKKSVSETRYGKQLLEKVGPHVSSNLWEQIVSDKLESEIRRQLVVYPQLRQVTMTSGIMKLPVNPEAGLATWVNSTDYGTTASGGAAQIHQLKEITLTSYKVASREYLGNEEEEDAIMALMPIIRDGIVRRVARAIDRAALRGAGTASDPLTGFATYDTTSVVTPTVTGIVTLANMRALRKDLGTWGLMPDALRFIVSNEVYYDLMEDTAFQTMEKVGPLATVITGQIGFLAGTPVLLSGEFPTKAGGLATVATNIGAICVAPANFIAGNHRSLKFETMNLVEFQRTVMVASVRLGMTQISTIDGVGVSTLRYS